MLARSDRAFGATLRHAALSTPDRPHEDIKDFAGLWHERPGMAALLTVFLLSLGGFPPTVGFIGTFGLWHGVKLLPALIEAVPGARWILIGDGGLLPDVRNGIEARGLSARVLLTGVLEHGRALEMLSCCDVCISPHVPNPDGSPFFGSPTETQTMRSMPC